MCILLRILVTDSLLLLKILTINIQAIGLSSAKLQHTCHFSLAPELRGMLGRLISMELHFNLPQLQVHGD